MKIYVGNLSYSTSEADIRTSFSQYGTVDSADIITDSETGSQCMSRLAVKNSDVLRCFHRNEAPRPSMNSR